MVSKKRAFSLDWAPDAIIVTGLDHSVVHVNPRAADLFGYRDEELRERPLELLIPDGLGGTEFESAPLQHVSRAVVCAHRDGTRFRGTARWRPVPGSEDLVVISIRDLDGELLEPPIPDPAAEAEPAEGLQVDILSLFAHDVRSSLQSVQYLCDSIVEHAPDAATAINEITGSIHTLLERVTRFRHSSRIEPSVQACKLGELLGALRRELSPLAERKGLRLSIEEAPDEITTDPVLFRELLHNLLANAIRHTAAGQVELKCTRRRDRMSIEIIDTGIGFDREPIDAVLDEATPSGRVDATRGGLGLAIVRQLAALLDCRVELDSARGRGTRVRIDVQRGAGSARDTRP